VPCESTTGQQRRLDAISKTGSGHARRLLVEAAWHYRKRPAIGTTLADRQDGQPAEATAVAWSAQRRLHRTWTRLEVRAKTPHHHRRRRCARAEGFCWAIARIEYSSTESGLPWSAGPSSPRARRLDPSSICARLVGLWSRRLDRSAPESAIPLP